MAKEVAASPAPAAAPAASPVQESAPAGDYGPVESVEHSDFDGEKPLYDPDDIAAALSGEDAGGDEGDDVPEDDGDPAEEAPAAGDDAGEAGEGVEGSEEEPAAIPMPEGWEESVWQGLPDAAKQAVQAREQAHAEAMGQKAQEVTAMQAQRDQMAMQANGIVQNALASLQAVVMADYQGINWEQLAQADPATYVKLQRGFQERMGMYQRVQQQLAAATQQYTQRQAAEQQQHMQGEFAAVLPTIKALYGAGYEGKAFAAELAGYMRSQGCPENVVNGLTQGYELTLVTKAMLYDKMQSSRAVAAKKVADAPKVQAPRGAVVQGNDRAAKARAILNKHPNSTDALAAVLETL